MSTSIMFKSSTKIELKDIDKLAKEQGFLHSLLNIQGVQYLDIIPEVVLDRYPSEILWRWSYTSEVEGIDLDDPTSYERDLELQPNSRFFIDFDVYDVEDVKRLCRFLELLLKKFGGWLENDFNSQMYTLENMDEFRISVFDSE